MPKTKKIKKTRTPKKIKPLKKPAKRVKKTLRSKPAKRQIFSVAPIAPCQPVETKATPVLSPVKPEFKSPRIHSQGAQLSRHVLNLKKVNKSSASELGVLEAKEQKIYNHLISEFKNKNKLNIGHNLNLLTKKLKGFIPKTRSLASAKPSIAQSDKATALELREELKPTYQPRPEAGQPALRGRPLAGAFIWPQLPAWEIRIGSSWPKPGRLIFPAYWSKTVAIFVLLCLTIILPFSAYGYYEKLQGKKVDVLHQASQALLHLAISQKAAYAQDLPNTEIQLQQSAANFIQAKSDLDSINVLVKSLIKIIPAANQQFSAANNIIDAGAKLSDSAAVMTDALAQIKINKSLDNLNLTSNLTILKDHLNQVLPDLRTASDELQQISAKDLPADYQAKLTGLQTALPPIVKTLEDFNSASNLLLKVLGQDNQKRYLVLFQNNNEIRPTGGFIGSYALVDIDRGNVKKIEVPGGGPYDLKGNLKAAIESPLPLHLVNARWEFQDANWFADLPKSAEKLNYLFEKSGGPTVDGLIFINASLIEQILSVTGPVSLPDYQLTISKDNFINEIQKEVEVNYDKTANRPKQIIADLTPILINKLLSSDQGQMISLLNLFLASLNEKEIQFYFNDYDLEKFVNQNNWGGKIKDTKSDYLDIVSTNIAGEKTDAKIQQNAILKVNVQPDGSIINNLTITKTHSGLANEPFYGVPNLDYMRIYAPKGSEFLSAEGFEAMPTEFFLDDTNNYVKDPDVSLIEMTKTIDPLSNTEILNEESKTVFANWFKVEPGGTKTATISYKLPFKLNLNAPKSNVWLTLKKDIGLADDLTPANQTYSLLWQKQSGKANFNIHVELNLPQALNYQYVSPNFNRKDTQNFNYTTELDTDKIMALIFKP